jgi:membrane protein
MELSEMKRATDAIYQEILSQFGEGLILLTASSLAYATILSIVPLIAVIFAIFKAIGDVDRLYSQLEPLILSNLIAGSGDQVASVIQNFIHHANTKVIGFTGFLGLLITSLFMLGSIEAAFNRIWRRTKVRSMTQKIWVYGLILVLGPLAGSIFFQLTHVGHSAVTSFSLTIVFFTFVYKFLPSPKVFWRYAFLSGIFTSILICLARWSYTLYVSKFVSYHKIYGRLAAVPVLLLWIYILWLIILIGAAFGASLQRYKIVTASERL